MVFLSGGTRGETPVWADDLALGPDGREGWGKGRRSRVSQRRGETLGLRKARLGVQVQHRVISVLGLSGKVEWGPESRSERGRPHQTS